MGDELNDLKLEIWSVYKNPNKVDIHVISEYSGMGNIKCVDKQLAKEIVKRVNGYNRLRLRSEGEQIKLDI